MKDENHVTFLCERLLFTIVKGKMFRCRVAFAQNKLERNALMSSSTQELKGLINTVNLYNFTLQITHCLIVVLVVVNVEPKK